MRTEIEEYVPTQEFDTLEDGKSIFPNSPEYERVLLGTILTDPQETMDMLIDLGVGPDWFYDVKHSELFSVFLGMHGDNKPIDVISLNMELMRTERMKDVGGIAYVNGLLDNSVTPITLRDFYIPDLRSKRLARVAMKACNEIYTKLMEGEDAEECVASLERKIINIGDGAVSHKIRGMKELMRSAMNRIEMRVKGELVGLKTGFRDFDRHTGGLYPGELVVLGGRPGCGKTTLSMGIAENVANALKESGKPGSVAVFSLEMDADSLTDRLLMSNSGVDVRRINNSTVAEDQKRVAIALGRLAKLEGRLIIDDTPGLTVSKMAAKARHYRRRHNAQLIVLDYLQLMSGDKSEKSRQEEISRVSVAMKMLAKELKIPIVALCQLNREIEKEKNRKPRKSDIRDSGQIEQDADFIGILYNPAKSPDDIEVGAPHQINLRVCKSRNGMADVDIPFTFIPREVRFADFQRGIE